MDQWMIILLTVVVISIVFGLIVFGLMYYQNQSRAAARAAWQANKAAAAAVAAAAASNPGAAAQNASNQAVTSAAVGGTAPTNPPGSSSSTLPPGTGTTPNTGAANFMANFSSSFTNKNEIPKGLPVTPEQFMSVRNVGTSGYPRTFSGMQLPKTAADYPFGVPPRVVNNNAYTSMAY